MTPGHNPSDQAMAPELSRLQRWFQSVITHADGVEAGADAAQAEPSLTLNKSALEEVVTRSRALSASERLAIYANAYHTRLLECLGEVFPMLARTLGEDGFNSLAFGYLQEYPSQTYTLNELGRHFPAYLDQTRPMTGAEGADLDESEEKSLLEPDWPDFLIDLAKLEWAIYEVFDGPGVEDISLLGADQALSIPADRWAEAKLKPVVCLRLLATRFPVNDYYTALRRAPAGELAPMPAEGESYVALTRRNYVVRRYNLSQAQFELLTHLQAGRSIGEALERTLPQTTQKVDEVAAVLQLWFKNWTAEGFFESVSIGN